MIPTKSIDIPCPTQKGMCRKSCPLNRPAPLRFGMTCHIECEAGWADYNDEDGRTMKPSHGCPWYKG